MKTENQPISTVQWVKRDLLKANDYNPNYVAPPEMILLKTSILETGWTQPIVVDENYTIIDGFHRFTVSSDPEVSKMTDGLVPVVIVKAIDEVHRRMATIRHNRARGSHAILDMSKIIQWLSDNGVDQKQIEERLGMEDEEIYRLLTRLGMPSHIVQNKQEDFSDSWVPDENGKKE